MSTDHIGVLDREMNSHDDDRTSEESREETSRFQQASTRYFEWSCLGFIVLLAAVLRLWNLGSTPPPAADEVLSSVDLHSISTTGRHFTGASTGLLSEIIPNLDGRDLISLIGTSVVYLRLVTAIFGILTIVVVFLLGKELFDRWVGLCAALILAIMPWSIYISRQFFPASEVTFLTASTIYLLLIALRRRSIWIAMGSGLTAAVSMYIYPVALLVTPLFVISVLIAKRAQVHEFGIWRTMAVAAVFCAALIPYTIQHVFPTDLAVQTANQVTTTKLVWNQRLGVVDVISRIWRNWASYFSPSFLLLHGDPNVRSSIQTIGQIGWLTGIVGIAGAVISLIRRLPNSALVFSWTVIFAVGDAVTYYDATGNSLRAAMGSVIWSLWIGIGLVQLWWLMSNSRSWRRVVFGAVAALLVIQTSVFAGLYFGKYSSEYGYAFESGYSQVRSVLDEDGLQHVPITFVGGYERKYVLEYFSNYRLRVSQTLIACQDLPYDVVHYTVLPRIFVIREDRDFSAEKGCIPNNLIGTDVAQLKTVRADHVRVLADYSNASSGSWRTVILFVTSSVNSKRGISSSAAD